jgi:hypothetical protein
MVRNTTAPFRDHVQTMRWQWQGFDAPIAPDASRSARQAQQTWVTLPAPLLRVNQARVRPR